MSVRCLRLRPRSIACASCARRVLSSEVDASLVGPRLDDALDRAGRGAHGLCGRELYGLVDSCVSYALETSSVRYALGAELLLRAVPVRDASLDASCADAVVAAITDLGDLDGAVRCNGHRAVR